MLLFSFSRPAFPINGLRIAVTAAVDPAFNTSRRVRFFIKSPITQTSFYHMAVDCAAFRLPSNTTKYDVSYQYELA